MERHGCALSPGTLYPLLHAMEEAGYLRSDAQVVGGKVRRYYRCTARGRKALGKLKVRIRELTAEVLEGHEHNGSSAREHGSAPPKQAARSGSHA